jgi:hypothetical protein
VHHGNRVTEEEAARRAGVASGNVLLKCFLVAKRNQATLAVVLGFFTRGEIRRDRTLELVVVGCGVGESDPLDAPDEEAQH